MYCNGEGLKRCLLTWFVNVCQARSGIEYNSSVCPCFGACSKQVTRIAVFESCESHGSIFYTQTVVDFVRYKISKGVTGVAHRCCNHWRNRQTVLPSTRWNLPIVWTSTVRDEKDDAIVGQHDRSARPHGQARVPNEKNMRCGKNALATTSGSPWILRWPLTLYLNTFYATNANGSILFTGCMPAKPPSIEIAPLQHWYKGHETNSI